MAGEVEVGGLYSPLFTIDTCMRPLYGLASWANGLAFKDIHFTARGLPVVKIAEVKGGVGPETKRTEGSYNEAALLQDGDLLFCWSGQPESSIGTFRWWGGPAWLNQHIFKLTPERDISAEYLRLLLLYLQPNFVRIAQNKQTTGLGHVTKADLRLMMVRVPSRRDQDDITDILTPLDDKIELNRRMAEKLEAIARALFESRIGAGGGNLFVSVQDLIDRRILQIGDGYRAKNDELAAPGLPFLRAANLNGGINTASADTLSQASVLKAGSKISRPGDVAFTSKGTVGRFARVDSRTPEFVYSPQICFWRSLNLDQLHPALLYLMMRSRAFLTQIEQAAGQTDMAPYVSLQDQRRMVLPVLPPNQASFGEEIQSFFSRQALLAGQTRTLAELRDTLIPKLISGELRIADARERIAAA